MSTVRFNSMEKINVFGPNHGSITSPPSKECCNQNQESGKWNELSEIVFITFENVKKREKQVDRQREME